MNKYLRFLALLAIGLSISCQSKINHPIVGDWVGVEPDIISVQRVTYTSNGEYHWSANMFVNDGGGGHVRQNLEGRLTYQIEGQKLRLIPKEKDKPSNEYEIVECTEKTLVLKPLNGSNELHRYKKAPTKEEEAEKERQRQEANQKDLERKEQQKEKVKSDRQ